MKKLVALFILVMVFAGCADEVTTNTPGFQAYKDDVLFRGIDVKAYVSPGGHVRLVALAQNETVTLNMSDMNPGYYYPGSIDDENSAEYTANYENDFLTYLTYDAGGPILNVNNPMLSGGTGYTESSFVSTTSLGGGSGMTVNTTVSDSGVVTAVEIANPGGGYEPGDVITVNGGGNNARFKIASVIEITDNSNGTLSGTFRFQAKNVSPTSPFNQLVSFQYGSFYQIPILPEL